MMSRFLQLGLDRLSGWMGVPKSFPLGGLFLLLGISVPVSLIAAIYKQQMALAMIPAGLLLLWQTLMNLERIYFLLMAMIPLSIEVQLPGGLGTDLPSEPLMWLLTGVGIVWWLQNWRSVDARFLRHPISLALYAHLAWLTVCTVTSQGSFLSIKFLLAKGWYLITFYFWAGHFLNSAANFKRMIWWFFAPLLFATLWVLFQQAQTGFSFEKAAYTMGPFFRNHVSYACILAVFLPYVWYVRYWSRPRSGAWWLLIVGIVVFIVGINFAYTRAAYVALLAAVGMKWLINWRKLKWGLMAFVLIIAIFIGFVGTRDNWLLFAPQYEKAISHTEFTNLLEATTRLEDISVMERVYRWVAATYMIQEHPVTGFGPGTFYTFYKDYTVSSFKTYVSDNPEKSGTHNYFLMTAVEQGLPGLLFFVVFILVVMMQGQRIYHKSRDLLHRRMVLAPLLSFMMINLLMLMNDLVETDKIGSLFFMAAAMLVNLDLGEEKEG